ncbi:MAG: hypothetical protein EXQ49_00945 [Acidobacteria bacterium]|nr:hypothetical protein [Acidobacteriota bacterium]
MWLRPGSDVILPSTTLHDLSQRPPRTLDDLAGIADFGPRRRELYGEEILAVVSGQRIAASGGPHGHTT